MCRVTGCIRYLKLSTLLLVGFILLAPTSWAQKNFYIDYTEEIDLPSSIVAAISQDSQGKYWFVTARGLMTYNGQDWHLLPDSLGLPTHDFADLIFLKDGTLVTAGRNNFDKKVIGVAKGNTFSLIDIPGSITIQERYQILETENGFIVYHLNDQYLFIYESESGHWTTYDLPKTDNQKAVFSESINIFDDDIYIATHKGLYQLKGDQFIRNTQIEGLLGISTPIQRFYMSEDRDTLAAIIEGELILKTGNREALRIPAPSTGKNSYQSYSKIIKKGDTFYFTSSGPLYIYNTQENDMREIQAHSDPNVSLWTDFILDRNQAIWIVGHRGISKVPDLIFMNFNADDGLSEDEVATILTMKNGNHFLGGNRGYTVLNDSYEVVFTGNLKDDGTTRIQDAIAIDDDIVWASTTDLGLLEIDTRNGKRKRLFAEQLPNVISVTRSDSSIWLATESSSDVYQFKGNSLIKWGSQPTMRRILHVPNDNTYVLSRQGVYTLEELNNVFLGGVEDAKNTYDIEWYRDTLFLATAAGLYYMMDGKPNAYELSSDYDSREIYALEADQNDQLWLGTADGIFSIKNSHVTHHFNKRTGLIGNEINRGAFHIDDQNRFWVGTDKGMSIIDLAAVEKDVPPPTPVIFRIKAENIPVDLNGRREIPFNNNDIEIDFGAYHFIYENTLAFEYRLVGLDEDWQHIGSSGGRTARYNYLVPGEYQFELKVKEGDGEWSKPIISKPFFILKPFYTQYWFIGLIMIVVVLAAQLIIRVLSYNKLNHILEERLQEKMKEVLQTQKNLELRNEELEKLNTELDTLVYSISHDLRAPISSSQGLINIYRMTVNEADKAIYVDLIEKSMKRLDEFIQNILKISRNSRLEISTSKFDLEGLVQEIIESQQYREEAKNIDFQLLCVDREVETDRERLSMILTNLISNAIVYSDPNKTSKWIKVMCEFKNDKLRISVKDNGKGIDEKYLNKIFDIFMRATDKNSGSGLGLYIASQTAEKLGATLSVESELGNWTEFSLQYN